MIDPFKQNKKIANNLIRNLGDIDSSCLKIQRIGSHLMSFFVITSGWALQPPISSPVTPGGDGGDRGLKGEGPHHYFSDSLY